MHLVIWWNARKKIINGKLEQCAKTRTSWHFTVMFNLKASVLISSF
uniref:Uncharacterized protein LOC105132860 isoform X3 n=1 Tax=Rhizophora mucronata TaxID=61149 RepID=A0A2P2K869_RHIMU